MSEWKPFSDTIILWKSSDWTGLPFRYHDTSGAGSPLTWEGKHKKEITEFSIISSLEPICPFANFEQFQYLSGFVIQNAKEELKKVFGFNNFLTKTVEIKTLEINIFRLPQTTSSPFVCNLRLLKISQLLYLEYYVIFPQEIWRPVGFFHNGDCRWSPRGTYMSWLQI